ncbi:MAG: response regulator [Polyangiales bacterium]
MTAKKEDTALGVARARFVDGLPRKATELKGAVALLAATPDADRPREEMRRRLHALYASAQVFRIDPLAEALKECIDSLDRARDEKRGLAQAEVDRLALIASTLPSFARISETAPAPPRTGAPTGPLAPLAGSSTSAGSRLPLPPSPTGGFMLSALSSQADQAATRAGFSAPTPTPAPNATERATPGGMPRPTSGYQVPRPTPAAGAPRPQSPSTRAPVAPWTKLPTPAFGTAAESAGAPRPAGRASDSEPGLSLDTIVSVLLVGSTAERLAPKLPAERFEVVRSEADDALLKAKVSAPDVVFVGDEILGRPGSTFVADFRSEAMTDLLPIVVVPSKLGVDVDALRRAGADDVLPFGADTTALSERVAKLTGLVPGARTSRLGTLTVRQLADRFADEVRRGLVDSVELGGDLPLDFAEGSELLAAALSAVARVRTIVASRAGDKVRFRTSRGIGSPNLVAVGETSHRVGRDDVSLAGRRAIVVDDDPTVVWFFAGLLREAGATVVECQDGAEALAIARKQRPDVILSDILMPGMDGLALCREVQRDPLLSDVPVILLSWKEDFLQRMRELRSGASAYLRKEDAANQILERVKAVLRPRARFEARLREGGEVRGRVEGLGVLSILRSVATVRSDVRVTIRDAYNLFELEIRKGRVVHLTRTASDGSFSRGPRALPQLLGVTAGRFTVTDTDAPVRATADALGPDALDTAAARLGALLDAVSGTGLSRAERIQLDEDVLASLLPVSPGATASVVERLSADAGPRKLLLDGEVAPEVLESVLVDLARRGAIVAVVGPEGEDRIAQCLAKRAGGRASEPPPAAAEAKRPSSKPAGFAITSEALQAEDEEPVPVGVPGVEPEAMDDWISISKVAKLPTEAELAEIAHAPKPEEVIAASSAPSRASLEAAEPIGDAAALVTEVSGDSVPPPASEATEPEPVPAPPALPAVEPALVAPPLPRAPVPAAPAPAPAKAPAAKPAATPATGGRSAMSYLGYGVLLAALAGGGYFVVKNVLGHGRGTSRTASAPTASETRSPASTEAPAARPGPAAAPAATLAVDGPLPDVPALYGRLEPAVTGAGVPVPDGQGALVVEAPGAGPAPAVSIGARALGAAPARVALAPGRYVVTLRVDDEERIRIADVEAGKTRILPP